jgi:hypothetical protein
MTTHRSLSVIAREIARAWPKMSPYAEPYVRAMRCVDTVHDDYVCDSGRTIVLYFLSNATAWRGEDARRIKAELKAML